MKHIQYRSQQAVSLIIFRAFYGLLTAVLASSADAVNGSIMQFLVQVAGENGQWLLCGLWFSAIVLLIDAFFGFLVIFVIPNNHFINRLCGFGNAVRIWSYLPAMFCFMAFCYVATNYGLVSGNCKHMFCRDWLTISLFMGIMSTFGMFSAIHESLICNEKLRYREDVCHLT